MPFPFSSPHSDISTASNIDSNDNVQYYYLEADLPFNAPPSIMDMASSGFAANTHAGLGIWDTTTDKKWSIELVANNYTGALLPTVDIATGAVTWNNQGSVVVTSPLDETYWSNTRFVGTSSGESYNDLIRNIKDNIVSLAVVQPVIVSFISNPAAFVNATLAGNQGSSNNDGILASSVGDIQFNAINSYTATLGWLNTLSGFGNKIQSFLEVYQTGFLYLTLDDYGSRRRMISVEDNKFTVSPSASTSSTSFGAPVVTTSTPNNKEVALWYSNLQNCLSTKLDASNSNIQAFLDSTTNCYGEYAFVFRSPTTVYNVSLGNFSNPSIYSSSIRTSTKSSSSSSSLSSHNLHASTSQATSSGIATPFIVRFSMDMPDTKINEGIPLSTTDWFVIAAIIISVVWGIIYFAWKLLSRKKRRRISFMGERIAEKTVNMKQNVIDNNNTANPNDVDVDAENGFYNNNKKGGDDMTAALTQNRSN